MKPRALLLKNGMRAVLRPAAPDDADRMLDYLRACAEETDFLLRYPEEWAVSVEQESAFLKSLADREDTLLLVCEAEGIVAGTCQAVRMDRLKTRHRATVSIALRRAYWGLGIAGPMFEEMEAFARARGVVQLELAYLEGNDRARRLYDRMGFAETGRMPWAVRLRDGTLLDEICMVKRL